MHLVLCKERVSMNNLICRKDECDNVVECDVDIIAITCSECCATLGVDNNIAFGG